MNGLRGSASGSFADQAKAPLPNMRITYALLALFPLPLTAQIAPTFDPSVPVTRNGNELQMAWAGGINFSQFSDIDLDGDGDKDLFLFDRSGNKVITLRNDG